MGNITAIYTCPNHLTWPSVQRTLANCPTTVGRLSNRSWSTIQQPLARSIIWYLCRYMTLCRCATHSRYITVFYAWAKYIQSLRSWRLNIAHDTLLWNMESLEILSRETWSHPRRYYNSILRRMWFRRRIYERRIKFKQKLIRENKNKSIINWHREIFTNSWKKRSRIWIVIQ